jgi:chromosome segregation ATPase
LTTASEKLQTAIVSLEQKDQELLQRQEEINSVSLALEKSKQSLAKIEKDKRIIQSEINKLKSERQVVAALVRNLNSEYKAVQNEAGLLGTVHRLRRIMSAVTTFLSTDITELVKQQKREIEADENLKENSRNIGKKLLDDK